MGSKTNNSRPSFGDQASPGKIFIGGLAKDATLAGFTKYFGKYGDITDSVIMKDRQTGLPRGFGFVTYADPSVVDKVIEETHVINGKQVEIKRTIPKGSVQSNSTDFKTKKIFVGGLPTSVTEDEFKDFFSKYGNVVEHQIILDHATNRSRGFGFIIFDNEQVVDDMLVKGNMLDMSGTQVEIKKAEPKKPSNPSTAPSFPSDPRAARPFGDGLGGFGDSFSAFGGSAFGPASYRNPGGIGSIGGRFGGYGGYGGSVGEFGGGYGSFAGTGLGGSGLGGSGLGGTGLGGSGLGGYRGESSLGYSGRFGSYGGGLGGGFGGGLGGYGRGDEGYSGYGGPGYGGAFDSALPSSSYGGAGGLYGGRTGYSGSSRYHPYSR